MDIKTRLNHLLGEHQAIDTSIGNLLTLAKSRGRFDSLAGLKAHLTEGAMLNVTKVASDCLSIPSGKYVVWLTDSGKTVLAPAPEAAREVHTPVEDKYTLHTAKLLGMWNKLERIIAEADMPVQGDEQGGHFQTPPAQMPDEPYTFGRDVGRQGLWDAMRRLKMGVTELANAVGVDKSTISRLLRDVEKGPGDPHGRNPSVGLAQAIADVLGVSVDDVLPPPEAHVKPTRSGTTPEAPQRMRQGFASGESKIATVTKLMVDHKVKPVKCITEALVGIPSADAVLNEFLVHTVSKQTPETAMQALSHACVKVRKSGIPSVWLDSIATRVKCKHQLAK